MRVDRDRAGLVRPVIDAAFVAGFCERIVFVLDTEPAQVPI